MVEQGGPILSSRSNVVEISHAELPVSILSALPSALVLIDDQSRIVQCSELALRLFAVKSAMELQDRINREDIVLFDPRRAELPRNTVTKRLFPSNDGDKDILRVRVEEETEYVVRLFSRRYDTHHFLVFFEDITEQTIQQSLTETRERLLSISDNHPLDELTTLFLDEVERLTHSRLAFSGTLNVTRNTPRTKSVSHATRTLFGSLEDACHHVGLASRLVSTECIATKRAVICNRLDTVPDRNESLALPTTALRLLIVPVVRMGRVVALLGVGNKGHAYTTYDARLLTLLSDFAWDIAEKKRAEELLHRTDTALYGSLNAVVVTDSNLNVTYLNPAFLRLFRLANAHDEFGRSLLEYWRDPSFAENTFREMFEQGFSAGELFGKRADGSELLVEFTGSSIRDRDGHTLGLFATFIDVTDYHRIQSGLRDAEEKFSGAFQVISDAVHITDYATGTLIEVNDGFVRNSGYTRQEALGKSTDRLGIWAEHQEQQAYFALLAKQGYVHGYQARFRAKDGRILWVEYSSQFLQLSGRRCLVTITRDITEQRAAAIALEESEQRFRNMFDLHDAAMLLIDPDNGAVRSANFAAERYFGVQKNDLVSRHISDFCDISPQNYRRVLSAAVSGITKAFGLRHRAQDGSFHESEVYASPIHYLGHTVLYAIFHDVTDRRRLEEHIQRVQRMDCLGNLASGVAHDINNVLSAILSHATVERDVSPPGSQLLDDLETIIQACIRGRTLVRSLLDFARPKLSEQRNLSINAIVEEEVRLLSRTTLNRITLKLELAPDLGTISGDASSLSHALMNLCINAVDAMPEGGTLTITTRNIEDKKVELRVADTGQGMSQEVLEKAIDPFFSTKPQGKGTGLGLSMVYSTAEAHAAQFEISSTQGHGTVVTLTFPTVNAPIEEAPESQVGRFFTVALSILVVDDDWIVLRGLARQLARLGHRVIPCTTGEEALTLLENTANYDLVVLDVNMPNLGGCDVYTHVERSGHMGPFLFVTGRPDETLQQFVAEHPGTAMLAKPFTQGELTSAIHQLYGATQRASIKQRLSPPVPFGPSTLHPNAGTRSGKINA